MHHVILVHGIRTHAGWFERAGQIFKRSEGFEPAFIKYGRFDLFRFMVPGPWRKTPIETSRKKIQAVLKKARHNGEKCTVIAHSNGTQVVATLLATESTFEIDNLIMCGAVVADEYDWNLVNSRVKGVIVNDYGVLDIWPAVARSCSWGYGYPGTNGIGSPVIDRMHCTRHSEYFTHEFMKKYWLPIVASGHIEMPPRKEDDPLPKSPAWFAVFEFPWKYVIAAALTTAMIGGCVATYRSINTPSVVKAKIPSRTPDDTNATASASVNNEAVTAAPSQDTFSVTSSTVLTTDGWDGFAFYKAKPILGSDGESLSFPDPPYIDRDLSYGAARTVEILNKHGIDKRSAGSGGALNRCARSPAALDNCPIKLQAAILELMGVEDEYFIDGLDDVPKALASVRGDLDEAVKGWFTPPPPQKQLIRLVIKNRSSANQVIYGLRLKEVYSKGAEGDGVVTTPPRPVTAIRLGVLKLADALALNCANPQPPLAVLQLADPLIIPAKGLANLEIEVAPELSYTLGGQIVMSSWETDTTPALARKSCSDSLAERRNRLSVIPARYRKAADTIRAPLLSDVTFSIMELEIRVEQETWQTLGFFKMTLP